MLKSTPEFARGLSSVAAQVQRGWDGERTMSLCRRGAMSVGAIYRDETSSERTGCQESRGPKQVEKPTTGRVGFGRLGDEKPDGTKQKVEPNEATHHRSLDASKRLATPAQIQWGKANIMYRDGNVSAVRSSTERPPSPEAPVSAMTSATKAGSVKRTR
ncbi:hypothetical protein [Caldimonas aquatica]|uniref:Uncharacterized protein n=1 Tax=Caldimonas aquatica TaxID=376175 RepID=A0ABY6MSF8_9BURK|nr:hypothetical protein [Schlegelella aquatica]UZD54949.1 hypothetical protein OMP39_14995 [Schlegelella aquatica]